MERAFAAALVVNEVRLAVAEHDIARLKIAVKKIIAGGAEKKVGEAAEIDFERVLVERNTGEAEKIVFKIIEVPGDGLAIEAGDGIADGVIEVATGFNLEAREDCDDFAVGFDDLRRDGAAGAVVGEKFEERGITEVFFEISVMGKIFGVNFRDGETMMAKVFRKSEEGGVLFVDVVKNADGGAGAGDEANDFAARAAELALKRLDTFDWRVKMPLEETFENVDGHGFQPSRF